MLINSFFFKVVRGEENIKVQGYMKGSVLGDVIEHMKRKKINSSIKILPVLGFVDAVAATGRHTSLSHLVCVLSHV